MHVVLGYFAISRKKRLTTHVAGTSGRAIANDIPPQYRHLSLLSAARVKDKNDTLRELALRVYIRRCKLIPNVRFKHSSREKSLCWKSTAV